MKFAQALVSNFPSQPVKDIFPSQPVAMPNIFVFFSTAEKILFAQHLCRSAIAMCVVQPISVCARIKILVILVHSYFCDGIFVPPCFEIIKIVVC